MHGERVKRVGEWKGERYQYNLSRDEWSHLCHCGELNMSGMASLCFVPRLRCTAVKHLSGRKTLPDTPLKASAAASLSGNLLRRSIPKLYTWGLSQSRVVLIYLCLVIIYRFSSNMRTKNATERSNSQFIVTRFSILHAGGQSLLRLVRQLHFL